MLKTILKITAAIAAAAFCIYFYNYSNTYVPWKSGVARYMPAPAKSFWSAKVFEGLLRKEITEVEWNAFAPPKPSKGANTWIEENEGTAGMTKLASRFESPKEFRAFLASCRPLSVEYLEETGEGRISVYVIGLNPARNTIYYRSGVPIQFQASNEELLKFIRDNEKNYNNARSGKKEYQLFK